MKRTHMAGHLRREHAGREACLQGWVQRVRDMGALVFVDVRDREGIAQAVFRQQDDADMHHMASRLHQEDVVEIRGRVELREESARNAKLATGDVELRASSLEVLSRAETPPFAVDDETDAQEDLRLRYRYLDLRRPVLQRNLAMRHRVAMAVRQYFDSQGFYEIETPYLFRSTPEGARDYLVPSRLHKGKFYALPQSPQILKQILMVSGYDRYFQIVRCFRDEDLRATRQPEFTQIDVEMSFVESEDVFAVMEGLMERVLALTGKTMEKPLPRLSYRDAMDRYGLDAPDLRFGMEIRDLTAACRESESRIIRQVLEDKTAVVRGIAVPGGAAWPRKRIDACEALVKQYGTGGLFWMKRGEDGALSGAGVKPLGEAAAGRAAEAANLQKNEILLFLAAPWAVACEALGRLRLQAAREENLIPADRQAMLWVTDFPAFEHDPEGGRWAAKHHPFTSPLDEDVEFLETDPGRVRAKAYDLVWNGIEMGGGSIRIHRSDVQERVFRTLGMSPQETRAQFSFLLDALRYGAPPHGGIAFGLDRLVMMSLGEENIRNVIAFPKTGNASCLMSSAPSEVSPAQLAELGLNIKDKG